MLFEVKVIKHRTETRLVVEECTVTVEAPSWEHLSVAIQEAHEDGMMDMVAEWEEVSTNDEDSEEEHTVEMGSYRELPDDVEPDLFYADKLANDAVG